MGAAFALPPFNHRGDEMELVTVKIRGTVVTARYGTLSSGDVLRTDAEFARHLVTDCAAAEYMNAPQPVADQPQAKPRKAKG